MSEPAGRELRVALLLDTAAWAGTEAHVRDLAVSLADGGTPVRVACAPSSPMWKKAREAGARVMPIARRGHFDPAGVAVLVRALSSGALDVLHAHNGRTELVGSLAVRLAGRGVCVATQHFLSPARATRSGPRARLSNAIHAFAESGVAHTIAISSAVRDGAVARGADPEKISVVLNGVQAPVPDASTSREQKRLAWDAGPEDFLIACVARLEEEKDIGTLVEAVSLLRERGVLARLVVAGHGSQQAALEEQARRLGVAEHVAFAGFVPNAADLMVASDACVLPSVAEPFGLAIVEAMALGRPVVATRAGGPPEIVAHGETGILVEPRSSREMAAALEELARDPQRAEAMGARGRERYEAHFTRERMAREVREVYGAAWARHTAST